MNTITVSKKELRSLLTDFSYYALLAAFLVVAIYFFFNLLGSYNQAVYQQAQLPVGTIAKELNINSWVVNAYLQTLLFLLVLFIPPIAATSIAQERTNGTLELLATLPISPRELVFGKFFSAIIFISIVVVIAGLLPFALVFLGEIDSAPIITGLFGLLLACAAFCAVSLACSALVANSTLATVLALAVLLLAYAIHMPAESLPESFQLLLRYLSPLWQLRELFEGVVTLKPIAYFISIIVCGLTVATTYIQRS